MHCLMNINNYINQKTEAAPLAAFRIFFGLMMLMSIVRFWWNGWIEKLYVAPDFFFSYYGFDWVKPVGDYTYLLFAVCGVSALMVALGWRYRIAIVVFFLSFTYIELMDKTTYLNHYYFVSLLSFLLIFLPMSDYFSFDAKRKISYQKVPRWTIDSIKILLTIVYFYAGLAKLNSDWLVNAMPLKIWLPSNYDLPVLGVLLQKEWVIYLFSWSGAIYDLTIPFLLFWRKTRVPAFILVVIFHVLTRVLFPIGMFLYIMIISALIFFDAGFHHRVLTGISKLLRFSKSMFDTGLELIQHRDRKKSMRLGIVIAFFAAQLFIPFRYLTYPGELFWTEEGYRFSWRVMLMEKAGYINFKAVDSTGNQFYVDNNDFLTPFQEKQMATQPDFILEYAHHLANHFESQGHQGVKIYAESYVALNGRKSQPYIDPEIDLAREKESLKSKSWILPFNDEIKGF